MKAYKSLFGILILLLGLSIGCNDDSGSENTDNFDRSKLLTSWVDGAILPSFDLYVARLELLKTSVESFQNNPIQENLENVRGTWSDAYKAWQGVSMFDIGKAEEIKLRNYTNIYPTNIEALESNIVNADANLVLPSNYAIQGFSALDYLLFGSDDVLTQMQDEKRRDYLGVLVQRMYDLAVEVRNDWQSSYKDIYVANDGSSGTAAVDKTVNDIIFYTEKFFRAGKIGIPAGVFSGNKMANTVEALYSKQSKALCLEAWQSLKNIYTGQNNTLITTSLSSYVQERSSNDLDARIKAQFDVIKQSIESLDTDFANQVETDNIAMLATYDEMQKLVVLFKVEMLQTLNIQVDYVDADGD